MRRLVPSSLPAAVTVLLVLTGCGDSTTATSESPATASSGPSVTESPRETSAPKKTKEPEPEPGLTVPIRIAGDRITPNAEVLEIDAGEPITLAIRSDRVGELHVHSSPETYVDFGPGRTSEEIVIQRPGSVEVEEHDSGALVLKLLVS